MENDKSTCPCCGARVPKDLLNFDAETGVLICNGLKARFTKQETVIFSKLFNLVGRAVSKDRIMTDLYALSNGDYPFDSIVNVYIFRIRKKTKGMGINISCQYSLGYTLSIAAPSIDNIMQTPNFSVG